MANILTRVKVITSHAGKARFMAELAEDVLGYIPKPAAIPSPYAYSPSCPVWDWHGTPVAIFETSHKRYEVYRVEGALMSDEAATETYIASTRS